MTSKVCCFTPSTADTTSTIISVTDAPLCLILTKASWPGVSIKVRRLPKQLILKAPILWVIPPSSFAAISDFLRKSIKVVLPWSTWPIMVMTACFCLIIGSSCTYLTFVYSTGAFIGLPAWAPGLRFVWFEGALFNEGGAGLNPGDATLTPTGTGLSFENPNPIVRFISLLNRNISTPQILIIWSWELK